MIVYPKKYACNVSCVTCQVYKGKFWEIKCFVYFIASSYFLMLVLAQMPSFAADCYFKKTKPYLKIVFWVKLDINPEYCVFSVISLT